MKHQTELASSSKTDEHVTPDWILDFARDALLTDQFDLDPFSQRDNPTNARKYCYLPVSNGLALDWTPYSTVWINPPFSKMLKVVAKVETELSKCSGKRIILLTKNDTRTRWSKQLIRELNPQLILVNDYVRFVGSKNDALFSIFLWGFNLYGDHVRDICDHKYDKFIWKG